MKEEAVTVQLEYEQEGRRDKAIDRINWRPIHTHNNGNKGPKEHRLREMEGSHHHSFALNWLTSETRLRLRNLPVAEPLVPDPADFKSLLAFVEDVFRIEGLSESSPPPWEESLFG